MLFLCMSSTSKIVHGQSQGEDGQRGEVRRARGVQYLSNIMQAGGVGLLVEDK